MKPLSQTAMLRWLVWRDVTLAWRHRSDVVGAVFFFVMVVTLFPLSVGPDTPLLRSMAPGVVWVAALLASTLSLGRLFADDYADGTLEQMLLTRLPVSFVVLGKVLAQWLVCAIPLLLTALLLGVQFGLSLDAPIILTASLTLGTPVVLLIGSIGAALTLGLRAASALTSLLVMPLYVPALVFGTGAGVPRDCVAHCYFGSSGRSRPPSQPTLNSRGVSTRSRSRCAVSSARTKHWPILRRTRRSTYDGRFVNR
jgi:heme exporter protein B